MPETFPWDSLGEEGEHYVAISPPLLKLIRLTASIPELDPHVVPVVRLLVRVARIDPVTGNLVIGVRWVRELAEGVPGDPSPGLASQQNARGPEAPSAPTDPAVQPGSSRPSGRRRA